MPKTDKLTVWQRVKRQREWLHKSQQARINETLELAEKFEKALTHPDFEALQKFDKDMLEYHKRELIDMDNGDIVEVKVLRRMIKYLENRITRPIEFVKMAQEIRRGKKKRK